jgi:hypothetical protein
MAPNIHGIDGVSGGEEVCDEVVVRVQVSGCVFCVAMLEDYGCDGWGIGCPCVCYGARFEGYDGMIWSLVWVGVWCWS